MQLNWRGMYYMLGLNYLSCWIWNLHKISVFQKLFQINKVTQFQKAEENQEVNILLSVETPLELIMLGVEVFL